MFPIDQFVIKKISETDTEGVFNLGPLPQGYGHTLGAVYRRILLSSIPGAAVTSVKIKGVQHEYTTLAGVQDDILTLVLRTKGLALISRSDEPVKLKLQAKGSKSGPREVKAADIEKDAMVDIINPDYVITVLADDKSDLDMEITVERGIGYALPNEAVRTEIGNIPVDANFNPVKLVSASVTNTRVGDKTDLDLLELKVVTNGVITPSAALYQAAEIQVKVSEHLFGTAQQLVSAKAMKQIEDSPLPVSGAGVLAAGSEDEEMIKISDLDLSTRLNNALVNGGYESLNQLNNLTEEEVRNIKGMGDKSFVELVEIMNKHGFKLI